MEKQLPPVNMTDLKGKFKGPEGSKTMRNTYLLTDRLVPGVNLSGTAAFQDCARCSLPQLKGHRRSRPHRSPEY